MVFIRARVCAGPSSDPGRRIVESNSFAKTTIVIIRQQVTLSPISLRYGALTRSTTAMIEFCLIGENVTCYRF